MQKHNLVLPMAKNGLFVLWDMMVGDGHGNGESLVYRGVVDFLSSDSGGNGRTGEDMAGIIADVGTFFEERVC